MLRWAKSRPLFRCVHVSAGVVLHRRVQSFAGSHASTASRYEVHAPTDSNVNLSASEARRIHGNASGKNPEVHRRSAHRSAKISVHRQDVDAHPLTKALDRSLCDAQSHILDGDAQISGFAANVDVTGADTVASSSVDAIGAETVASASKVHALLQTLLGQIDKVPADLQQKLELLELEQVSLSEARCLLKSRALRSCSVQELAKMLQELKKCFPSTKLVHGIVVRWSSVLLQPAEHVQQKLKLLRDFQVEEKVICKLCARGGVLSLRMESLQKNLKFFEDIGMSTAARNMMLWRAPLTLGNSIEKSVLPSLEIMEKIGLKKEIILKVVQHSPNLFNFSQDKLAEKCEYIRQLGFSDDRLPRAFSLINRSSIENIEEHLRTLRELGFADEDVKSMVRRQPSVLGLSSENLRSKVDFLIGQQHRDHKEIVCFPTYLMYSLRARIIPRFRVYNESANSRVHCLSSILSCSDSAFSKLFTKATG